MGTDRQTHLREDPLLLPYDTANVRYYCSILLRSLQFVPSTPQGSTSRLAICLGTTLYVKVGQGYPLARELRALLPLLELAAATVPLAPGYKTSASKFVLAKFNFFPLTTSSPFSRQTSPLLQHKLSSWTITLLLEQPLLPFYNSPFPLCTILGS